MATNNQRLTAYITPENWERLQEYATEQGFYDANGKVNQSPLVNSILNSFFSSNTPSVTPIADSNTPSVTPIADSNTPSVTPIADSNTPSVTPIADSDTLEEIKADLHKQLSEELTGLIEVRLGE